MGSMFLGRVLMAMYEQPAKAVADIELEPIKPGAWAAWARSCADEQATTAAAAPAATSVARVRGTLVAATKG